MVELKYGEVAKNSMFLYIPCARLNNLIPNNVMGIIILKRKFAFGSCFAKIIWKPLPLKINTTLSFWSSVHQAMLSAEII